MCPTMVLVDDTEMAVCSIPPGKVIQIMKDVTASSGSGVARRTDSVSSGEVRNRWAFLQHLLPEFFKL
jgi:hypothetical protein